MLTVLPQRRPVVSLELRIPPVAVTILFGLGMWIVATYTPSLTFVLPWRTGLGVIMALIGLAVGTMGILAFRRARTTVNPFRPNATSTIVSSGIYRASRNPMYLGLLLMLTGWELALSNLLAVALLPAFVAYMTRFQILVEERALHSKFGGEFVAYRDSVRRWL
jgi:protein-S-isoprenylcysteine O-methyltransferase Ste14